MRCASHFRLILGFGLCLLAFVNGAFSGTRCPDSFADLIPYDELPKLMPVSLRPDQMLAAHRYVVQFKGGLETFDVQFLRREGDEIIFRLGQVEHRRAIADFHEIRTLKDARALAGPAQTIQSETPAALQQALKALRSAREDIETGIRLSPLIIAPTKLIAKVNSVQVIGRLTATKSVGLELAREVTTYDSKLSQLGFRLPAKTTLVVNDRPVLASPLGPVDFSEQIRIPGRGAAENTLLMNPIKQNKLAARDPTILRHERAHSVLFATYSDRAFVNESKVVQEALADFLSAQASGSPVIGANSYVAGRAIRDISTRETMADLRGPRLLGAHPVTSLMDVRPKADHDNSLLISNALWRIRESIGAGQMDGILKPLIDDLNLHVASANLDKSPDSITGARSTIEYSLASFRKTLADRNLTSGVKQIDQLANELGITENRIAAQSSRLDRTGDFNFDGSHQTPISIILMHAPSVVAAGGIAAGIIYGAKALRPEASINVVEPRKATAETNDER